MSINEGEIERRRMLQRQKDSEKSGVRISDSSAANELGMRVDEWRQWRAERACLSNIKAELGAALDGFVTGIQGFHAAWMKYLLEHEWDLLNCLSPYPEDDGYSEEDIQRHEASGDPELLELITKIRSIRERFGTFFFLNQKFKDTKDLLEEHGFRIDFDPEMYRDRRTGGGP